jgi:hypothetical protein
MTSKASLRRQHGATLYNHDAYGSGDVFAFRKADKRVKNRGGLFDANGNLASVEPQ